MTSRDAADRVGEVKATLTVGAFHQFTSELHPQKVRAGRIARLRVENQGNIQEIFNLLWLDRAAELDFKPPQMQLKVSEGKESFAEFRAVPRTRALLGGEKTHAFTAEVSAHATAGEPQVHNGEVVSRALIPSVGDSTADAAVLVPAGRGRIGLCHAEAKPGYGNRTGYGDCGCSRS